MREVKVLAMCVTENLSWQANTCSLCHRLSKTFFIIKSVKNIYFAHFDSRLRHGIILWGVGGQKKA